LQVLMLGRECVCMPKLCCVCSPPACTHRVCNWAQRLVVAGVGIKSMLKLDAAWPRLSLPLLLHAPATDPANTVMKYVANCNDKRVVWQTYVGNSG